MDPQISELPLNQFSKEMYNLSISYNLEGTGCKDFDTSLCPFNLILMESFVFITQNLCRINTYETLPQSLLIYG